MRSHTASKSNRVARRSHLLRRLADSESGFTIIEVVISAVLVASIAAGTATALIATSKTSGDQRQHSQANAVAQQDQERLRGMSISQLAGRNETRTVGPYNGTSYRVISTGKYLSSTGTDSCSSSGVGAAAYVLIRSVVDWIDGTGNAHWASVGRPPVVEESLITPTVGGTLLTNVKDQSNAPLAAVTVTATGPNTASAATGTNGCTVFGGLATGDYMVEVEKPGYVDKNGNASPNIPLAPATVSGTGTSFPTPDTFTLGQAGAIQASFEARHSATSNLTGQHAPSLSVSHAERANGAPLITIPGSPTGPITTATNLFPFTDAYTAWSGRCTGEQPANAADRTSILVGPGALATTPAVKEPAMNLRVWYPSNAAGNRRKPDQVKLTYTQTVGGICSESWLPAIRSDAVTSGFGSLVSPGQPFAGTTVVGGTTYTGSYTICAAYDADGTGSGLPRYAQLTTQSLTNFAASTVKNVVITATSPTGLCP